MSAQDIGTLIKRCFRPLSAAPQREVERACDRVLERLQQQAEGTTSMAVHSARGRVRQAVASPGESDDGSRRHWAWAWSAAAAVFVIAGAVGTAILWRPSADLYRVVEGEIRQGQPIGSERGAVIELVDGSRVEIRSQSELSLERAEDGLRIRLNRGGIIVNAAKRRTGHLYVQTKDVTVSVVGTVFLVDAVANGSRVAVIEGSVRVQHGTSERQLLPGEQVTTDPLMEAPPVSREISWSRNAETLRARLQQSTRPVAAQQPVREMQRFEEASIRLGGQAASGGGRGGGGARRSPCSELFLETARDGSITYRLQIDPRRFAVTRTTLYTLIAWAHGRDCTSLNLGGLITGGPSWVESDEWDIQALIPEGAAASTVREFVDGNAPELSARLRNLLVERFQLVIRSEKKDVSGYVLTRGEGPLKLRPRLEPTGPGLLTGGQDELGGRHMIFMNVPESNFARMLMLATGRMVLDRTGIKDGFYLDLEFSRPNSGGSSKPSLFKALEEVGLKLEETTLAQETLFIERVERPTEN